MLMNYAFGISLGAPVADPTLISRRIIVAIIGLAVAILYFGLLHGWKGQSLGKMVGNMRVINMDGTPISKRKAFARALAYMFGSALMALAMIIGVLAKDMTFLAVGVALGYIWVLADYILALVDTRMQRSLHDRICGTRVIRLNS